ncbi:MAG: outer membrane beta-barrel domain-containing protein [Proteobacteria bacterium]|jgi:outer membrane beta-barrel protein|nr:outer membrane beta-barrel domain-containing protein [Pseudomonadota bacterium]
MDSRIQRFLIVVLASLLPASIAVAAQPKDLELEPLVVREPDRREIKVDDIDSENFEVGAYGGILNVQDFGSNPVYGVRAAYHITEDFFLEGLYGRSELGETSFEQLSGNVQLLTDDERQFSYYNLSVGYNVLPGEAFIGRKYAFRGGLYLVAGAGSSDFAGDQRFTVSGGFGYRLAATDWLSLRVDVRDYVFKSDLLGSDETLHNLEFTGGLTLFF